MRTTVLVVLVLAFVQAASAAHPSLGRRLITNLDNDRAKETILARNHVSSDHQYARGEVTAYDHCAGERRAHVLTPSSTVNSELELRGIQGRQALGRPGVLFIVRYEGGRAIARVARLRRPPNEACPVPVNLFEYSTESPPRPPREGNLITSIDFAAGEYGRAPGREVRLIERYGKSLNGPVTEIRRTDFRYLRSRGRYVEYRSVLIPAR